jgi:hypothetical protein
MEPKKSFGVELKIIEYSRIRLNAYFHLLHKWWDPTINLISEIHHSHERREHAFNVLQEYFYNYSDSEVLNKA